MVFPVPHGKPLYSMWKWPGQRPEPRPGCVSELVDFSYGCWFLSFSGSVLHGFQQWCFSRRNSTCQLWAWPGVRRGAADTWGKRTEPSPSCHGSALIIMPESIISWLLFKGNHGSDSVPATAVTSVPKLRKRDLPGGRQKWLLVIPKGSSSSLPLLTVFKHHENMVLWQMLLFLWKACWEWGSCWQC